MKKINVSSDTWTYIIIVIMVIFFFLWIYYLIKSSDYNKDNYDSIESTEIKDDAIPAYKLKKCGHLLNNRFCHWCRYYRFHPNDKRYYKE